MQENIVTITIDTYSFINSLKNAGFTEQQAKAVVDEILKINFYNVASKDDVRKLEGDISELKQELKSDIALFRQEADAEFKSVRKDIELAFAKVKAEILWWIIPLILGIYGLNIFNMFRH